MKAEEFVKTWLKAHRSPVAVEQVTDEEQKHFESVLTDLVKARDEEGAKAFAEEWCVCCAELVTGRNCEGCLFPESLKHMYNEKLEKL